MTHQYEISGMHCQRCVSSIKEALAQIDGVTAVSVQLAAPQAVLQMDKHIALPVLQKAISGLGDYNIQEFTGDEPLQQPENDPSGSGEKSTYFPLFLIFIYIALVTSVVNILKGAFSWMQWMSDFMAGFFLVFSFFKLMNLKGFAEGYRQYDTIAKKLPVWGYIYPFAELGLGIAFLTGFQPMITAIVTLLIMSISSVGVIRALQKKQRIRCACLGTVIQLPLGTVTLLEDLLMVLMSLVMILAMA